MNKFEQASSDGHQMSLVGGAVRSNASWVLAIWGPLCGQTDTHERKHYLPATLLAGGNYLINIDVEAVPEI